MSAQIDTYFDSFPSVNNQKHNPAKNGSGAGDSVVFANLLREQLPGTFEYSSPSSQLDLPEGSKSDFIGSEYEDLSAHETEHTEEQHSSDDEEHSDQSETANSEDNSSSEETKQPLAADASGFVPFRQDTQTQSQTPQDLNVTSATTAKQQSADAAKPGAQTSQNTAPQEQVDLDMANMPNRPEAKGQNNGLKATVTDQDAVLNSKPASNLAASAAVSAQTAKTAQVDGERVTVADMLLETSEEANLLGTKSAKAGTSPQGNGAGGNSSNNQQTADQNQQANITGLENRAAVAQTQPAANQAIPFAEQA
ncbi:MAG: hypothetical protein R3261_10580, partial [Alphaproteobacteria bacterium]|nr:hypothetical protein [Alphaproteobacteria bacterium]